MGGDGEGKAQCTSLSGIQSKPAGRKRCKQRRVGEFKGHVLESVQWKSGRP